MGSCLYGRCVHSVAACWGGCFARRSEAQTDDPAVVEGHRIVTSLAGVNRSDPAGKPDYTLVDLHMLERWATHMTAHIGSKGRNNWRYADTVDDLERFRASAWRHFVAWQRGETDEDHAAALFFNVAGAELVGHRLRDAL